MLAGYSVVTDHADALVPHSLVAPDIIEQSMALSAIAESFGSARNWQRYASRHGKEDEARLALKAMENLAAAYHGLLVASELCANVENPAHPCTLRGRI